MVFRKDYAEHKENPPELVDEDKRLVVGAGINTRDYEKRVPALVAAGADVLCVDSSDGYSEWQAETIQWITEELRRVGEGGRRKRRGRGGIPLPGGCGRGLREGRDRRRLDLHHAGAERHRPRPGHGRDRGGAGAGRIPARETGIYVPICSDGGIVQDYHIVLALAMGADFVMMGQVLCAFRRGARSAAAHRRQLRQGVLGRGLQPRAQLAALPRGRPGGSRVRGGGGRLRAVRRQAEGQPRHHAGQDPQHHGELRRLSIPELQARARITLASTVSIREGSAHDILLKENEMILPTS